MSRQDYNQKVDEINSSLIVTVDDIKASSLLDFNIDESKIIPYVKEAQDLYLEPLIGSPLLKALQNVDRTWIYDYLVTNYITPVLIHWALGIYIKKAPYQVGNGGVYKHFSEDSETASVSEVRVMAKEEHDKAETYGKRLVNYLDTYSVHYPEWDESTSEGVKARQEIAYLGGWVLDNNYGSNCGNLTYDPDLLTADFWYGNNNIENMGFDLTTLVQENTLPNYVWAQPIASYYWMVSTKDFVISQSGTQIPLSDFSDTDPLAQTYVKGEEDGKFWIRIKVEDTYETPVQFEINKI